MRRVFKVIGIIFGTLVVVFLGLMVLTWYQTNYRSLPVDASTTYSSADFEFRAPSEPVHWVTGCERFAKGCIAAVPLSDADYSWWNRQEWMEAIGPIAPTGGATADAGLQARDIAAKALGAKPEQFESLDWSPASGGGLPLHALNHATSVGTDLVMVATLPDARSLVFVCHVEQPGDAARHQESCLTALGVIRYPSVEAQAQIASPSPSPSATPVRPESLAARAAPPDTGRASGKKLSAVEEEEADASDLDPRFYQEILQAGRQTPEKGGGNASGWAKSICSAEASFVSGQVRDGLGVESKSVGGESARLSAISDASERKQQACVALKRHRGVITDYKARLESLVSRSTACPAEDLGYAKGQISELSKELAIPIDPSCR